MCFREILGVNQDLSPQGVLVRQFPSAAQQAGASAVTQPCLSPTFRCLSLPFLVFSLPLRGLAQVPASYQPCDEQRASQRWVAGKTAGTVQLDGTTLCLHQNATMAGVELAPCSATSTVWGMRADESVHVGTAGKTGSCLEIPRSACE